MNPDTVMLAKDVQQRARALAEDLKKISGPPWEAPVIGDFAKNIDVLSFDQTLTNTGYVRLLAGTQSVEVIAQGTLHPKSNRKTGFEKTWEKAKDLNRLLRFYFPDGFVWPIIPAGTGIAPLALPIVLEQPLVGPGFRPESSLVAGAVINNYAKGPVHSMGARRVSSILCGNPHHRKDEIAAAVAWYIPESAGTRWSEHSRDAAAQALAWLWEQKQASIAGKLAIEKAYG